MKLRLRLREWGGGGAPGVLVVVQEPGDVIVLSWKSAGGEVSVEHERGEGGVVAAVGGYRDRRTDGEQTRTSVETEPSTERRGETPTGPHARRSGDGVISATGGYSA